MAEPTSEPDGQRDVSHTDHINALTNGTGGAAWTDAIHGHLSINGQRVSTPFADTAHLFQVPHSESLDVAMSVNVPKNDMTFIHFAMSAHGVNLEKEECGTLDIWARDIEECNVTTLDGEHLTNPIHHFQPSADASV
jgi:hypothetical protein